MSEHLYKTDTGVVLRFYESPELNNFLSGKSGTPVYDTVLSAEVIVPGQAASTLSVEIERVFAQTDGAEKRVRRSSYYDLYKAQVEAYKNDTGEFIVDGTPIKSWSNIDAGTAQTLIAQGVYTVEALAGISDAALGNIGLFGRTLREQAKAYLVSREFGIPSAQMASQIADLQTENENLKAEIEALKAKKASKDPSVKKVETQQPPAPPASQTVI